MAAVQLRVGASFSSNNREVVSLESVSRTSYHGKIVLLVKPELQEGKVGRSMYA
jgi:hypothetical protein